jgi:uncharacterized protein YdeI (YjbR/CyaY-like superfamily)
MDPIYFPDTKTLRKWFEEHHLRATELVVGYYKTATKKETITWSESVDEALCFGWIDGVRRSIDGERYTIRFTPRKPGSNWSAVNIEKMENLIRSGKMKEAGLEAYSRRKDSKSRIYSYETNKEFRLPKEMADEFMKDAAAWQYFQSQSPSYRKVTIRWVLSAKQEPTQHKRLTELIASSAAGDWIKAMRWGKKKGQGTRDEGQEKK